MRTMIAAVLIAAQLACMGPTRHYSRPADALHEGSSLTVTVTLNNGNAVRLTGAQIVLDSLVTGWTNDGTEFVGFPVTDIARVSTREPSPGRTALLIGGVLTTGLAVAMLAGGAGEGPVLPGEEGEEEEF